MREKEPRKTGNPEHTPLPWKAHSNIGKKSELGIIADAAPCIICTMSNAKAWPTEAKANAAFIVEACNHYEQVKAERDSLQDALREAVCAFDEKGEENQRFRDLLDRALGELDTHEINEALQQEILKALTAPPVKPSPLKVVVEVLGGVAEVTTCPNGVECEIIDHDNLNDRD